MFSFSIGIFFPIELSDQFRETKKTLPGISKVFRWYAKDLYMTYSDKQLLFRKFSVNGLSINPLYKIFRSPSYSAFF